MVTDSSGTHGIYLTHTGLERKKKKKTENVIANCSEDTNLHAVTALCCQPPHKLKPCHKVVGKLPKRLWNIYIKIILNGLKEV